VKAKIICQNIAKLARQARQLPQRIATAVRWYRTQNVRAEIEAERLDRIRNPLKYLGK